VKSPKIYFHDSGLLHHLLGLARWQDLLAHPKVGASWEGFVLEQAWRALALPEAYFWATHGGAELDMLFFHNGRAYGLEATFNEAPKLTAAMHTAIETLELAHLWVIYPGQHRYPAAANVTMLPLTPIGDLPRQLTSLR
jgi:uncharacterized protein